MGNSQKAHRKPGKETGSWKKLLTWKKFDFNSSYRSGHKVNLEKSTNFSKGRVGAVTKAIENVYDTFK